MSHWAEIDKNNLVIRVLVGDNNELDEGAAFMQSLGGTWIQTSFNAKIRGKFAAIGDLYDDKKDIFTVKRSDIDKQIDAKIVEINNKRQAIADRLGLTADEAKLLLG